MYGTITWDDGWYVLTWDDDTEADRIEAYAPISSEWDADYIASLFGYNLLSVTHQGDSILIKVV